MRYRAAFDDSAARFPHYPVAMPSRVTTKLSLAHCGPIKIPSLALTIGRGLSPTLPRVHATQVPTQVLLAQCEWTYGKLPEAGVECV